MEGYALARGYQRNGSADEVDAIDTTLEGIARKGAREMLAAVLEAEVAELLGRNRYERAPFRGYRNGHLLLPCDGL